MDQNKSDFLKSGEIMLNLKSTIKLMAWILIFEVIGFILGLLTQANLYPWYANLNKSSLTPPGEVFSIVWTCLYALLAMIAWILSNQKPAHSCKTVHYLYATQMLMNWAWTPLFFHFHWLKFSAIWLVILTILNGILIIKTKNKQRIVALLLIPYVIWLGFATYLNIVIASLN